LLKTSLLFPKYENIYYISIQSKDIRNYRLATHTFGAKMSADADDAIESLAIIVKNYFKFS